MSTLWGWIPNLSGIVASRAELIRIIGSGAVSSGVSGQSYRFSMDTVDRSLCVVRAELLAGGSSEDADGRFCSFKMMDETGLCRLQGYDGSGYSKLIADRAWAALRRTIDSNSGTSMDCSAMDRMVEVQSDSVDLPCVCEEISRRFVEALETDCGFTDFIDEGGSVASLMKENPSTLSRARYRSNSLYLDSFIYRYSSVLTNDSIEGVREEAAFRVRKNDILADYVDEVYRVALQNGANRLSRIAICVALAIGIASIAVASAGVLLAR